MSVRTATRVSRSGIRVDDAAAADVAGDSFANTGSELLFVKNGSGGAITVTLDIRQTVDSAAVTDPTVSVGAGQEMIIGPFPPSVYNDTNSRMNVSYSAVTSVTVKVLQFANV